MRTKALLLILLTTVFLVPRARPAAAPPPRPRSPEEERKTFRLADEDLVIELVAAEPDVVSPVALAWDEDGRLFVAEMTDYPVGPPAGQVKLLEDPDEHGKYRKATVFADKLAFPNGVLPWKGGVLVTAAPNIWYLKDTAGRGQADERRVVLTGFNEGNQQLRVNGLLWGLDNWVYGANGRSDGTIRKPADSPNQGISIRRRDFRFKPETGAAEAVAGFSQFGLARDDWGDRFLSWNTTPFRHVVLEERYLNRNPYLAAAASVAYLADQTDQGRLFAISPPPTTFNREPIQFFNASCGHTLYRGDILDRKYHGNIFVCEPLTNLVHRRALEPAGATFVARRTEPGKEFLASTDPWFHPVSLATGPDGALYVVDFYRQWVEHPQFVPQHLRGTIDWRKGAEHGRIWRIRPKAAKPQEAPHLRRANSAELVRHLGHTNGWWRDTAQRLLVERQDRQAVPLLKDAVARAPLPQARVHALWTLQGLGALEEETLLRALDDGHPRVQEHGVRLTEGRLVGSAALPQAVEALVDHPDLRVRLQAALALGDLHGANHLKALARIARRDAGDEWVRLAVLSGLKETAWPFLRLLTAQDLGWGRSPAAGQAEFLTQIAAVIGVRHQETELAECLYWLAQSPKETAVYGRLAILAGLAEGLDRAGKPLHALLAKPSPELEKPLHELQSLFHVARAVAASDREQVGHRVLAIQVLTRAKPDAAGSLLLELLHPRHPSAVQSAAARGFAALGDKALTGQALERWGTYSTGTRRDLLAAFLRSPDLAAVLVDAIEQEKLTAAELDPAAREVLRRIPNADLHRRAEKLLQKDPAANRQEVLRKYQTALGMAGDRQRGAAVFAKNCLVCHQMQGQGHRVGPDLTGVAGRPRGALLEDILDPSKEVAPDFLNFVFITTRGQVLTGLVAAETATAVKLRRAEGAEDTVLRTEIQELRASGKSFMPEGLEQTLSLQDVADLLEFLQRPTPLPIPPNKAPDKHSD